MRYKINTLIISALFSISVLPYFCFAADSSNNMTIRNVTYKYFLEQANLYKEQRNNAEALVWRSKVISFLLLAFFLFILIMLVISIRRGKRLSVKIGFIFAIVHFLVFMRDLMQGCEGGAFYTFLSDIFLVPVYSFFMNFIDPYLATIIVFGILGTVCWFFIGLVIARL